MKLKGENWHCEHYRRAQWRIFRRRPKKLWKGGKVFLGDIFHTMEGYEWRDLGGSVFGHFRSLKDALENFRDEMKRRKEDNAKRNAGRA